MEYSITNKENKCILYQGYEYTKYRENQGGVVTWRCRIYFSTKCRALLKTQGENIVGEVPQHCHQSNPQKAQANILKAKIKKDIKAIGATPRNILGNALALVNSDVLEHLPKQSSLTRNLGRHKETFSLPNPATTDFIIPEKFLDLILYDTGTDDPERILAIGNNDIVSELHKDVIYGDGTFDKAPNMFYQLYTWHAKIGNSYPPCIYFLLQKKNMSTYNRMFVILKILVPNMTPQKILLDFEKACMSAAQAAFPQAEIKGCYFHLSQSLIRKINSVGLKALYESDIDIKLKLKSLAALSFVPILDLKTVFDELAATFPDEDAYNQILAYFCSTYIEGVAGRSPLFPIRIWNHFEAAAERSPKTTNCCEGFHNSLNSIFHCSHPSIWNLFDGLRRDMACQRLILANAQTGRQEVIKKKYEAIALQVSIVVQDYHAHDDKLRYLRRMANLQ